MSNTEGMDWGKKVINANNLSLSSMNPFQKFRSILTGWKNLAFKNPIIEELATQRIVECSKCDEAVHSEWVQSVVNGVKAEKPEKKSGLVCRLCDCPIEAKSRSPFETCKLKKWGESDENSTTQITTNMKQLDYMVALESIAKRIDKQHHVVKANAFSETTKKVFAENAAKAIACLFALRNMILSQEQRSDVPEKVYTGDLAKSFSSEEVPREAYEMINVLTYVANDMAKTMEVPRIMKADRTFVEKTADARECEEAVMKAVAAMNETLKFEIPAEEAPATPETPEAPKVEEENKGTVPMADVFNGPEGAPVAEPEKTEIPAAEDEKKNTTSEDSAVTGDPSANAGSVELNEGDHNTQETRPNFE